MDLIAPAAVLLLACLPRRFVAGGAFVLLTIELFVLNGGFNALVDARYYKPELPIMQALKSVAPPEPYRIAGLDWMFLPNASAQYRVEDIRGSDPMSYDAYTELLKPIVIDDRSIDFDRVVDADHRLLDELNVRYLLTAPGQEPGGRWRPVYRGADGSLFENPTVLPRFYVAEGEGDVELRESRAGRFVLRVHARTPVRVASSQVAGPGWSVSSGRRIDSVFIGLRLPAGTSTVEVVYRPWSFWGSVPVALIAVLLLVGIALTRLPLRGVPSR